MTTWIEVFKKNFTDKEILNPGYAVDVLNGRKYCKLCDGSFKESVEDHLAIHAQELNEFNNRRKAEAEQKKKETRQQRQAEKVALPKLNAPEFYETPCSVCNQGIKRSGKRGRPPTKHQGCK